MNLLSKSNGNAADVLWSGFHSTVQSMDSLHLNSSLSLHSVAAEQRVDDARQIQQQAPAADESLTTSVSAMSVNDATTDVSVASSSAASHASTSLASSHASSPLPSHLSSLPGEVSAVQESASSQSSQTVVYSRSSELPQNTTASRSSNTASADYESARSKPVTRRPTSSGISPSPPDHDSITRIEIPRRDYPAELRERQYDAVVISTDADAHIAATFGYILSEFITLEV